VCFLFYRQLHKVTDLNLLSELSPENVVKLSSPSYHDSFMSDSMSDDESRVSGYTDNSNDSGSGSHSPTMSLLESSIDYHVDHHLTKEVGKTVFDVCEFGNVPAFIASRIHRQLNGGSFLVTNLASVVAQYQQWRRELPMVEPFYAVKCNPDPVIVRLLASLGCNFDCATMGEIDLVLNGLGDELSFGKLGKAKKSIVYANPAKMHHMLDFALKNDVQMTVFDGEDELRKIASVLSAANRSKDSFQLLLRLTTDDRASICRFSKKFGCPVAEAPKLLRVAKELGLTVVGVSFHVGSGCGDSAAYTTALEHAYRVFAAAKEFGMPDMTIIDIGGGFPGDTGGYGGEGMPTFQDLARGIRSGIDYLEGKLAAEGRPLSSVRFIAEPGRYFVSASTAIATKVYSRKGGNDAFQALYVDDGVYGSFNNVVYDHATPIPRRLPLPGEAVRKNVESIPTAVFGPTCDGLDQMCSLDSTVLERCEVDDWLVWENMGAYTHTASFVFNGYTHIPEKIHCYI
jgi:ornithine decarboxylase